jgi:SAM-dependent methyltransferase
MSWVIEAFGSWYPVVYPHRDDAEAAQLVTALDAVLGWPGRRVLDVGCGGGRHLAHVHARGGRPTGLDLSPTLLEQARTARRDAGGNWPLVRGDMRVLPFADGSFDVVASFFTSFGYFDEDADRRALAGAARALRPGGWHVLDYLNREEVLAHPKRVGERTQGGYLVREERRIEDGGRRAVKRVEIRGSEAAAAPLARYEERVTLYRPEEIRALLAQAGLAPVHEWGDYSGARFDAATSPRHVVLSRKAPA